MSVEDRVEFLMDVMDAKREAAGQAHQSLAETETCLILEIRESLGVPAITCPWPIRPGVTDVGEPTLADGGRR